MIERSLDDKKTLILEYEKSRAHELARRVIDKPVPSVWMILIPVFFVFYGWKIREYSKGLKNFSAHYLISRERALDIAFEAEQNGRRRELDDLVDDVHPIAAEARPSYLSWMSILVEHYRRLLAARGDSVPALIRTCYRNKSTYEILNKELNAAESAFNQALLPNVEGDQQDIRYVAEKMEKSIAALYREEVGDVFS